jgi:hypothetical protein
VGQDFLNSAGSAAPSPAGRHLPVCNCNLARQSNRGRKSPSNSFLPESRFLSPLLLALLVSGEQVARKAGLPAAAARRYTQPIVGQTIGNYRKLGPAAAFSGPLVRGDASVVREHLKALRELPEAAAAYRALARAAMRYLPVRNRKELQKILRSF